MFMGNNYCILFMLLTYYAQHWVVNCAEPLSVEFYFDRFKCIDIESLLFWKKPSGEGIFNIFDLSRAFGFSSS